MYIKWTRHDVLLIIAARRCPEHTGRKVPKASPGIKLRPLTYKAITDIMSNQMLIGW